MKLKLRRPATIYALVIMVMMVTLLARRQSLTGATLVLHNGTTLPMNGVAVGLVGSGAMRDLGNLAPGAELRVNFKNRGDGCWLVRVSNYGGRALEEEDGYVGEGANYFDHWTLAESDQWRFESTVWWVLPPWQALLP